MTQLSCSILEIQGKLLRIVLRGQFFLYNQCFGMVKMDDSENRGTPKSSILILFSIINHPFWGIPNFWKHPYGEKPRKNKHGTQKMDGLDRFLF